MLATPTLLSPAPSPRARIQAAQPDLHPDTPAFRAAVVLLAGPEHGFNIDRIATRCALPRLAVAACVRRLIDNGVWAAGRAACGWRGPDDPRFWNDAAVAEGRLLRRTLPGGAVEWAPPGRWEKAYDFVGPQSDPGGALLYLDPTAPGEPEGSVPPEEPAAPARAPGTAPDGAARASVYLPGTRVTGGGWLGTPTPAAAVPDLFPGTQWLR